MKYYSDKDLNITADLKHQITHDEMRYRVAEFLNHRTIDGTQEFLTRWEGFDIEDATWEPVSILFEDVPKLCQEYVANNCNKQPNKSLWYSLVGLLLLTR